MIFQMNGTNWRDKLVALSIAGLLVLTSARAFADEEQYLLATLKSGASISQKCSACQRLRVVGTTNAVPALAELLRNESTSQAARYALEGLPFPEAITALRQALPSTSGQVKAGVIDSLGWRRDVIALPLLKPLLADPDTSIAAAAASALGRIGGEEAVAALTATRAKAPETVLSSVLNALLQCAESHQAAGDAKGAATIYRDLFSARLPDSFRIAAWRGLVIVDAKQRAKLVIEALTGADIPLLIAALKTVRELNDKALTESCVAQWSRLPAEAQLAVLDSLSIQAAASTASSGTDQLRLFQKAALSPHLAVRIAAWKALGDLGGSAAVPALTKAAATGEPAERDAAREGLARLRGPGVSAALLAQLASPGLPQKLEILQALGERGDSGATAALLQNAANGPEPVRLAALEALRKIALPDTLLPILALAAKSKSETEAEPALRALYAVCQATPRKDQATRSVLDALKVFTPAERRNAMPVLAELGTPAALQATLAAATGNDPDSARQAVRVLAQWPNAAAAQALLDLARASTNAAMQTLATRGCIEVAAQEPDPAKRLALLQEAKAAAQRPDEKKQALGKIGQIPTPAALETATAELTNPLLATEAALAAITIAEQLAPANPALASETAVKVLACCKNPDIVKRALALRGKPVISAPFIQDWLVAGPYRQPGATGAEAVFDIVFDPEKPGEQIAWKAVPRGEQVNLLALFPNEANCAAYLKTQVITAEECDALLSLGSDDGVKAWLNGAVVHRNNTDRGDVPDQDLAPIHLRGGANDLMLKITQGGGGWSAHARIVGTDSQPIRGLIVKPQP